MPFAKRFGIWIAACALTHAAQLPAPVFSGRDLISNPPIRISSTTGGNRVPGPLATAYNNLNVGRTLLVHDCSASPWCLHKDLQFARVMAAAAASRGVNTNTALKSWIKTLPEREFEGFLSRWKPGKNPPLHLLAVVNRLDLAVWEGDGDAGRWVGAETRFVYGASYAEGGQPASLTVIVEFQHEPMTWTQLKLAARAWASLPNVASTRFPGDLVNLLGALGIGSKRFSLVRIRTNSNTLQLNPDSGWLLGQWNLSDHGWIPWVLDDELQDRCFVNDCQELLNIWKIIDQTPAMTRYKIPANSPILEGKSKTYTSLNLTPFIRNQTSERPRNILSLQQCSQCHSAETKTRFTHVANRKPGPLPVELSPFLAGKDSANLEVDFGEIENKAHPVKLTVRLAGTSGSLDVRRRFHDAARRRLFLAAVLIAPDKFDAKARELISSYNASFSH